jgi:hypothetical protein
MVSEIGLKKSFKPDEQMKEELAEEDSSSDD